MNQRRKKISIIFFIKFDFKKAGKLNGICGVYLKARILNAVRNSLPGVTGNFRQKFGNAISMSLLLSSSAFDNFKLFGLAMSFATVVVVDDADDEAITSFVMPNVAFDVVFGTCFWYRINMANEIR